MWEMCVTGRSLTHTSHAKTSLFRKSVGRVCQNQPQASKQPLKTYMGAQSTTSRLHCFSYSRMVAAISRRVFRCFEKVVRSRPDRPTNAIAQPDRPDIDRKRLHRPARSTSTSSEQLSSTTNSTISRHDQETSPLGSRLTECVRHTALTIIYYNII